MSELQEDEILKYTNYPRTLTAQLLSDWVFTQYPKLLKNVIKIITDGINIGNILNQERYSHSSDSISLPFECGRVELVDECFLQLKGLPSSDFALEIISIINNNPINSLERWMEYCSNFKDKELTTWIEYAYYLQVLHKVDTDFLVSLLDSSLPDFNKRIQFAIQSNRKDIIDDNLEIKEAICDGILKGEIYFMSRRNRNHIFSTLSHLSHPYSLIEIINSDRADISFKSFINHRNNYYPPDEIPEMPFSLNQIKSENDKKIQLYFDSIADTFEIEISNWKNSIIPWDTLVEKSRQIFGEKMSQQIVAVIAAGIKSQKEKYDEYDLLDDGSKSLCKRARNARLKSGNIIWWQQQIEASKNIEFTFLVFFTWGTFKTIYSLLPIFIKKLEYIDAKRLEKLIYFLGLLSTLNKFDLIDQKNIENVIKKQTITPLLIYILSLRFPEIKYNYISDLPIIYNEVLDLKLEFLIERYLSSPNDLESLSEIKELYKKQSSFNKPQYSYGRYGVNDHLIIPYEIATKIMIDCKEYPRLLSALAEKSCRIHANKLITPVGKIAEINKWFIEEEIK